MNARTLKLLLFALGALISGPALAFEPLPDQPPIPKDNPQTTAKIELGKKLYLDPRLSVDGTVSCNSCHNVMAGGDDDRATSAGVNGQRGGRNAPTVWNAAFLSVQFWDGRANSLEEQAKGPLINPVEMGNPDHDTVIKRLKQYPEYVAAFNDVFGKDGLNIDNLAKAIASFERMLITPGAPFDRYAKGEKKAIAKKARQGAELFQKIGCITCHSGPAFAGPPLPEGTGFFQRFPTFADNEFVKKYELDQDLGRYEATKNEADKHMFRVPTLRNVAMTAPYFHNGKVRTLDEAVRVMAKTQLNRDLSDDAVEKLVAFLETLTGPFPELTLPRLPEKSGTTTISAH
ncbi:MAG: cytochrome-c peroxidase [Candidatus Dadabacteria bacterium]|nr:MAG: cytochrome-c peroxidase [Candidatus Dadabacteria bacterium]